MVQLMRQKWRGHEKKADELTACTAPTEDMKAAEEETKLEGHEKKVDELATCTAPTEDY